MVIDSIHVLAYDGQTARQNILASRLFQHDNAVVCLSHLLFFNYNFGVVFLVFWKIKKYHRVSCWLEYSISEPSFALPCSLLELVSAKIFSIYVLESCVLKRGGRVHH